MDVNVPSGLFKENQLTYADMQIWMLMRMDRKNREILNVYSPERLAQRTNRSRGTIYNSIQRLTAAGWYEIRCGKPHAIAKKGIKGPWVNMPGELIIDKDLKPRDMVMYGHLKKEDLHHELDGKFTYRILEQCTGACVKTARRAVKALEKASWLLTHRERESQMAPINYTLDSPSDKYCRDEIALIEMRMKRPSGHGEALALSMVTLAVETNNWQSGTRMSILPSPDTGEMMEADILLPDFKVVIEFNGEQHYGPTPFASAEDVAKQQRRDTAKVAMLINNSYRVVILTAGDLSVETIVEKLQGLVPLRDLRLYKRLVNYLNRIGERYRRKMQRLQAVTA